MNSAHSKLARLRVVALLITLWLAQANAGETITLTTLHSFTGLEDGANPVGLLQGKDGNFYGTASDADIATTNGPNGRVFRITPDGASTNLHVFSGAEDRTAPQAGLVQDADGNFYGTTWWGTVFEITPSGDFTTLLSFNSFPGQSNSHLVLASDGNFYTMGNFSGRFGLGTLVRVTPDGTLTVLKSFDATNGYTGWYASNPLLEGADGNLYGATIWGGRSGGYGTIFKATTAGELITLVEFTGTNGAYPGALVQGADGNLYGTTVRGGRGFVGDEDEGDGTIFKRTANGIFTTLASFDGTNGYGPNSLMQASDGNFYGTTGGRCTAVSGCGPTGDYGTIFKFTGDGALISLFSFSGTNGANPRGLVHTADGSFYGTTTKGGTSGHGTIFRFQVNPEPPTLRTIRLTGGMATLTWASLAGRSYQVRSKADLTQTNWSDLGEPVIATNTTASASDRIGADRQRFYRVVLLP